ncbi:MAG: choice-of-anchor J domain-containing protein, partial [Bacteroidales bacterium]|nr:choice-of-anchor J domain-containing protein [Bacteroidales bacterium]
FEADLSRPGTYGILVEAVVAGDENPGNNSARKTVTCIAVDPYVMDFEHCEDFAIADLLPWRTEDGDETRTTGMDGYKWPHYGEPMGFMAFNPAEISMSAITPVQEGEKFGLAICAIGKRNDDWLISPKLKMPAKDASVSYYVRSYHVAYKETYEVLVSTTDGSRESFVMVGEVRTATDTWTKNEVDLSAYNDREIYIAFRYTAQDQFFFMIDDIRVAKPTEGTEDLRDLSAYVKSYPNPVSDSWTVTAYGLEINRVEICSLMGEIVYRSPANLGTDTYRVHMEGLMPGMYTARVYTNAGVQVIKVIVR